MRPGGSGGKMSGVRHKLKTASAMGHPPYKMRGHWGVAFVNFGTAAPEEVKFLKISHERPTLGPHVGPPSPTLGDGGKLCGYFFTV